MAPRFVGLDSTFDQQRIVINEISVDIDTIFDSIPVNINDLSDVNAGGPSTGQVLKWSGSEWQAASDLTTSGAGIGLSDLSVTISPSGINSLTYNNITGVFAFTPTDLSGYATTSSIVGFITSGALDGYATTSSIVGFITSGALDGYATTSSIVGFITSGASGSNLTGIVTSLVAGENISLSAASGRVTIDSTSWRTTAAGIHTLSNVGVGTTNPTEKLTVAGKIQLNQLEDSSSRLIFRAKPGNLFRWNIDNDASDTFRIFSEDDATTLNGVVRLSISTTGTVTAAKFSGDGSLLTGIVATGSGVGIQNQGSNIGIATIINFSTNLTASFSSGTATISLSNNPSISGILTADQVYTSNNNNGQNVRIGDDVWLGDINVANTMRLSGAQNSGSGFIVFGNSDAVALGRTGTGPLYYGGNFTVAGIVTASSFSGNASSATYATSSGISTYSTTAGVSTYASSSGIATYASISGVSTYATSSGISTQSTKLQNTRTFQITGDIVGAAVTFDGTGNVSIAATIQPNSVALGSDTTGDYVQSLSGTSNQITVTNGTGEGSTPSLSVPNQFTAPQDVTVTRDLQVNRNLNVNGNITIGGTSATLFTTEFKVYDPDIVLGFRTDALGNDISTDTTANHGGIAIASTEGSPLISLYDVGIGETNPATYKKFMWFKSGAFSGLGTDAWISNYAIGIGSTQIPNGVRLAAGGMQVTDSTISAPQLNISGISTYTNGPVLIGSGTSTGTASQRLQVTGGAYVSNRLGIGVTNTSYPLEVAYSGTDSLISGIFIGGGIISRAGGTLKLAAGSQGGTAGGNNILLGNSDGIILDGGSSYTSGIELKGGGGNIKVTQGNLLVGSTTSTGTASQPLQVTGGGYVSGNLGVGATNPIRKLDITTSTNDDGMLITNSSANGGRIRLNSTGTGGRQYHIVNTADGSGFGGGKLVITDNTASDAARLSIDSSGNILINTTSATGTASQPLQVTGGGYVSGNLGVGATNPTSKLFVVGDAQVSGIATASTLVATKNAYTGSDFTNSTFGNGWVLAAPASTTYYKIATLPASSNATFDHLTIEGLMGGWVKDLSVPFKMTFSNRENFDYKYESYGSVRNDVRIIGISTNSTVEIWAQHTATAFTKLAYNITNSIQVSVVTNPTSTTTAPIGTTVFDSSSATYKPRFLIDESDNVIIGAASATGTTSQPLQVTGGAYVSGNTGIGIINPSTKLHVVGDSTVSGVTNLNQVTETVVNAFNTTLAPSTGTLTVDTSQGTVVLGDLNASVTTWAFTNVPTANSKATTITLIIDGDTAQTYGDACSVNGSAITGGVKWSGGSAPTATNNFDVITFTIVKDSAGTINVFGSGNTNFS